MRNLDTNTIDNDEAASEASWATDSSNEDSSDNDSIDGEDWVTSTGESYKLLPDKKHVEVNAAADLWLSRFPDGASSLYPQLFVVQANNRDTNASRSQFLDLPAELRNLIYEFCFDSKVYLKRSDQGEDYAPLRDCNGKELQRICIDSENVELKFLLSTGLMQTSRQLRLEAMPILFLTHVVTVEWLFELPRFVKFLGEGCKMVRYLDIWDTLDIAQHHNPTFRTIIANAIHFSELWHFRIVFSSRGGQQSLCRSFFNRDGCSQNCLGGHSKGAVEDYWPAYKVLRRMKAKNFTLAMEAVVQDKTDYVEFDQIGAYHEVSQSMKINVAKSLPATGGFEAVEMLSPDRAIRSTYFDNVPGAWQGYPLAKAIPLYNYIREFLHNNHLDLLVQDGEKRDFATFPTARRSAGNMMQDCAFCYLSERHCGYHAMPDQPPFVDFHGQNSASESNALDDRDEDVRLLQARYQALLYTEMHAACCDVAAWFATVDEFVQLPNGNAVSFESFSELFHLLNGWPIPRNMGQLARSDYTMNTVAARQSLEMKIDKNFVTPWDLLYGYAFGFREFYVLLKVPRRGRVNASYSRPGHSVVKSESFFPYSA